MISALSRYVAVYRVVIKGVGGHTPVAATSATEAPFAFMNPQVTDASLAVEPRTQQ